MHSDNPNNEVMNEELVNSYNQYDSRVWNDRDETQKAKQILGLIRSILESRLNKK